MKLTKIKVYAFLSIAIASFILLESGYRLGLHNCPESTIKPGRYIEIPKVISLPEEMELAEVGNTLEVYKVDKDTIFLKYKLNPLK